MSGKPPSHTLPADYARGVQYWETQAPTLDGVLGGYGSLTRIDALSSRTFILTVCPGLSSIAASSNSKSSEDSSQAQKKRKRRALDVGCGIGRVSESVLIPLLDEVDLVEPADHFIREAHRAANAGEWRSLEKVKQQDGQSRHLRFYKKGLQDFHPATRQNEGLIEELHVGEATQEESQPGYDVVMCQWCLGHLSDSQLVTFLEECKASLRIPGESVIIVKENTTRVGTREYDSQDHSWTRSKTLFQDIFAKAGLKIVRDDAQRGFPKDLFPVHMWALR